MGDYLITAMLILVPLAAALATAGPQGTQPVPLRVLDDMDRERFSR